MNKMTCEMCGGTDLMKQDGVFVCQSCGCQYSVEEAKKLMIEGTVKIDNTDAISKYLEIAEHALESKNYEEVENYASKILEIDSNNSRAWFIKGKAAGWESTLANIRINEAVNCFSRAIDKADKNIDIDELKKQCGDDIANLCKALILLGCNHFQDYVSVDNFATVANCIEIIDNVVALLLKKCNIDVQELKNEIASLVENSAINAWEHKIYPPYANEGHPYKYIWEQFKDDTIILLEMLKLCINISNNDDKEDIHRYKKLIEITQILIDSCSWKEVYTDFGTKYQVDYSLTEESKNYHIDNIMKWHKKIKEIDNDYVIPKRPEANTPTNGCYVATAVYGSYDCHQVWVLRRFRDYTLAKTWYGRTCIKFYYAVSPTIVKYFGKNKIFLSIFKPMLDRLVMKLRLAGVLDTPYKDRDW